jgi:hypothetical protein
VDLELGEKVEFIKTPDGCGINIVGYKGTVDARVSGGWKISLTNAFIGKFDVVVGSADWNKYVKKLVVKDPTPLLVSASLRKWHVETLKTIKRG